MPEAERRMATVGLLMLAFGAITMHRTRGKPLTLLGLTVLTARQAVWLISAGAVLVGLALMLANPGES